MNYNNQDGMLRIFADGTAEFYIYSANSWVTVNSSGQIKKRD